MEWTSKQRAGRASRRISGSKRLIFVEWGVRSKINRLRCFAQIPQAAGIVLEVLCGSHLLDSLKAAGHVFFSGKWSSLRLNQKCLFLSCLFRKASAWTIASLIPCRYGISNNLHTLDRSTSQVCSCRVLLLSRQEQKAVVQLRYQVVCFTLLFKMKCWLHKATISLKIGFLQDLLSVCFSVYRERSHHIGSIYGTKPWK